MRTYIPQNITRETICFTLCSCIFPLSLIIHRDLLILLNYSLVLYIALCKQFSIRNTILITLIGFLTFFLREQSGLFVLLLLLCYIWINTKKFKGIMAVIIAIVAVMSVSYLTFIFDNYQDTLTAYGAGREEILKTAGLSAYAERLPFPLKEIALLIQGQFTPLPIWAKYPENFSLFGFVMGTIWAVISIFWFRVFTQSIWFVIRKRKQFPSILLWFYLVFMIFLFMNVSNADPRRMMCMYIIPYAIYVYNKHVVSDIKDIRLFDKWYYSIVSMMMLVVLLLKA